MGANLEKEKIELEIAEKELEVKEFVQSYSKPKRYLLMTLVVLTIPVFFIAKYTVAGIYLHSFFKGQVAVHEASFVALPVQVVETELLPISGRNFSAFAVIKNPNKQLSATDLNYTFHFYSANGDEISGSGLGISGSTFLLAGQQKYIVAPNISFVAVPASIKVLVANQNWTKRSGIPNVILATDSAVFANSVDPANGFTVDGNFRNQSNFNLGSVKIISVVLDKNAKILAVNQTTVSTIVPQEQRGFHFFWPVQFAGITGSVRIFPETNVLDPNNIR